MLLISDSLHSTPLPWLPGLSNIEPPALRRKAATDKLVEKIVKHDSWPIEPDILNPPLLRLTSRKPLWLDLQLVDIKSRWRYNWKSPEVVNSHLVCDPTIQSDNWVLNSLGNSGLCWVLNHSHMHRNTAVPVDGNGDLLVHLSTHLCHYLHSHHPTVLHCFARGSKPTFSTNASHLNRLLLSVRLPSW